MTAKINTTDTVSLDSVKLVTHAERPELENVAWGATSDAFPEYNNHMDVVNRYWSRLDADRPEFQFYLVGRDDEILARAKSLPIRWDGTTDDLPAGFDGAFTRGFEEPGANALCAVVIALPRNVHSRGISSVALAAMRELARRHGFADLIAPVRPNWKDRYPLVPIEQYADWRRGDGLLFDPWMRTHERLGARVLRPEPESARITGSVSEWEGWTQMAFPQSGVYWFPGALSTVSIDRGEDLGSYWEPNVWMHHRA